MTIVKACLVKWVLNFESINELTTLIFQVYSQILTRKIRAKPVLNSFQSNPVNSPMRTGKGLTEVEKCQTIICILE